MARIPNKIKSIDGSKETLKLVVRITDLWFVGTPNKSEQAEIVFLDSEGDQIHAVCKLDHLKSWKADLKENSTYVMHNFKVVKNDGQFRVCEHEEADLHELPFKEFRFVEFANVVAGNFMAGLLFLSYLNERGNDGPMVIILTHARIKDAQGSYPASVSNSFKASKLLINDPILEIQEFKERDLILQKPGSTENVSCSRRDMLILSHLRKQQLTALQNMIIRYLIARPPTIIQFRATFHNDQMAKR
ncbi:hypothetical protein JHK84_050125 [Glycine max]|nr:hypothetical protein JHK84_050125 [Glycine max]